MFKVGDKVVYPLFGAGVIEAIEEKEILGEKQLYYILKMSLGKMEMMIPSVKMEQSGVRQVVDEETMEEVLDLLHDGESDSTIAWNQRYRINMDKMKSGDIYKGSEVIRDLIRINKQKPLGTGEKKMLDDAMQIMVSELALVKGIGEKEALDLLNQVVYQGT
ncbi:CarD family transcriptional regulator [Melghirimyces profundicolus]|uniref:CarD family transcriptional regulator n=1 Tax=Melghirimyces profundicolus TaxID=1242148 RepID=A0A2T6B849_9BACL|nr:CarD family transcriptional regulator [Melghirimyces profundicolus]PTX52202.1 CarD family transcriptional regulator [Melghirimyces profundicolus]